MTYSIDSDTTSLNRVVLKGSRTLPVTLAVILIIIGSATLPFGVLILLGGGSRLASFVSGIAILFITAGIILAGWIKIPHRLIFDNDRGILVIQEKRQEEPNPSIPFSAIDSFQVTHQVTRRQRGVVRYYAVNMVKKDGAVWTLFTSQKKEKAQHFCKMLATRVDLSAASASVETSVPGMIRLVQESDPFIIEWKNAYSAGKYIATFLVIASFGMILYGARSYVTNLPAYWIAVAFIIAVAIYAVMATINNIMTVHRIEIGRGMMIYRRKGGMFRRGEFAITLEEIASILLNFSIVEDEAGIFVLTHKDREAFLSIRQDNITPLDVNRIIEIIRIMMDARKIDAASLTLGERIHLENLLQKAFARETGRDNPSL